MKYTHIYLSFYVFFSIYLASVPDGQIGIAGNKTHGRVSVIRDRQYRPVCASTWSQAESDVVCRELGYGFEGVQIIDIGK